MGSGLFVRFKHPHETKANRQPSKESTDAGYDALLFGIRDPDLFPGHDLHVAHGPNHCCDRDFQVSVHLMHNPSIY
jgi:hypothetical protein